MIITLKSNVFNDPANPGQGTEDNINQANRFTNSFPGGLILKKNSSVSLLNCTYNIKEGYVIGDAGASMIIYLPPDTRPQTRTVAAGSYTGPELAAAIQVALRVLPFRNASDNAWNSSLFDCNFLENTGEFEISIKWSPTDNIQYPLHTGAYTTLKAGGDIQGGAIRNPDASLANQQTYYYRNLLTAVEDSTSATFISQFGLIDFNLNGLGLKVSNVFADNSYFGVYEVECPSVPGTKARIALSHATLNDIANANIAFAFDGAGPGVSTSVCAYENVGLAIATQINFAPDASGNAITALSGDKFRILIPVQYNNGGQTRLNAIYQKYVSGVWTTLEVAPGTTARYSIKETDKVLFRGVIITPPIYNKVPKKSAIMTGLQGAIRFYTGVSFPTPGTNYFKGERISIEHPTPVGGSVPAIGYITNVNATGGITDMIFENCGIGYSNTDTNLIVTGLDSGQTDARLNVLVVNNQATIVDGGTGYTVDDVVNATAGADTQLQIKVVAETGGVITDFDVAVSNAEPLALPPSNITFAAVGAGDAAIIQFNSLKSILPGMKNPKMTGFVEHETASPEQITNPLGLHQRARLEASTLGPTIGFSGTSHAVINGLQTEAEIFPTTEPAIPNTRVANNLLVHLDSFPITSYHKNGQGRCIAALPYGDGTKHGLFHDRSYNLTYHSLENKSDENHNEMRVRITDAEGSLLQGLVHPTVINLDVRPTSL